MSIKAVNALSHYTDWTIGHVHSGALGWVAMVSFGAIYCLVPWLWNRKALYSIKLVGWHFWISTIGILLYITSMWVSGIMQGLMWRAYDKLGFLSYSFVNAGAILQRLAGAKVQQGCASKKAPSRGPSCWRHVIPEGRRRSGCRPDCGVTGVWSGQAGSCRRSSPGYGRGGSGDRAARRSSAPSRTRSSTRRTAGCW